MRLYVIRHGQTAWNLEQRNQGHIDIPLDNIGLEQARLLASGFRPDEKVSVVVTSDLQRALQTATPLAEALGAELIVDPRLRERSFGQFEGMLFSEFDHVQIESGLADLAAFRPPGGESLDDLWERLSPVAKELRSRTQAAAIVTHGGSGSMLIAHLIYGSALSARSFRMENASITELTQRRDLLLAITRYNDTRHLQTVAAIP